MAKRSITLPSYKVISPVPVSVLVQAMVPLTWCSLSQRHEDPLVFCLRHPGTSKCYFKADSEILLRRCMLFS